MEPLLGKWIWFAPHSPTENVAGCFAHPFTCAAGGRTYEPR